MSLDTASFYHLEDDGGRLPAAYIALIDRPWYRCLDNFTYYARGMGNDILTCPSDQTLDDQCVSYRANVQYFQWYATPPGGFTAYRDVTPRIAESL